MSEALRITAVNAAYDPGVPDGDALLERYETLTGWCDALTETGARVHVVQRFSHDTLRRRAAAEVRFVRDRAGPTPSPWARLDRVVDAVAGTAPHVVHVNGLGFPRMVRGLRTAVGERVPIVVQDHAGVRVPSDPGPLGAWRRAWWKRGLSPADAISFSAVAQARPWREAGILGRQDVLALFESSTRIRPTGRIEARGRTSLAGRPLVLWVGRLVPNKDPLTVLVAFEQVVRHHPQARLAMVFQDGTLVDDVTRTITASRWLGSSVTLVGRVPRAAIADYCSAADVYVSGSHAEGSGYALIEAMACGLVPVVTAIPSFAAIAGPCGVFWPPGDVAACAGALMSVCDRDLTAASAAVGERFLQELSWPAIAGRTLEAYQALVAGRRPKDVWA